MGAETNSVNKIDNDGELLMSCLQVLDKALPWPGLGSVFRSSGGSRSVFFVLLS